MLFADIKVLEKVHEKKVTPKKVFPGKWDIFGKIVFRDYESAIQKLKITRIVFCILVLGDFSQFKDA
jgi:hypothetical protein